MDEVEVESKPGTYPNLDDIVIEDDTPTLLLPCITCNKTFKPEALQRHTKVCERNATKKRKTFDSFKQRVQGTELAEFLPFSSLQKKVSIIEKPPSPKKVSSRWKETHEAFVSAIRAARGEGSDSTGGSGEPRSILRPPDHEQCLYCERHFGPKAFDRHQQWCREQHSRHPPVIASSQAKERLEARIKYRAPPIKSKRAITRDKYSPLVQRKVRQVSPNGNSHSHFSNAGSASSSAGSIRHTSQSQLEQSNRLSKSGNSLAGRSSQIKEIPSPLGFNRGMAGRTSLRASNRAIQRSSSPGKQSPGSGKAHLPTQQPSYVESGHENYDRESMLFTASSVKKLQSRSQTLKQHDAKVLETQKTKPQRKNSLSSVSASNSQTLQIEVKTNELKENNKNDQLWSGNPRNEPYDPYASAERQMMELLRSDSAVNINSNKKCNTNMQKSSSPAPSLSPMPSPTLSPKPSPLETSPTSAFTRYAKESEFANEVLTETESGASEGETATVISGNLIEVETVEHHTEPSDSVSELNEIHFHHQLQPNRPICQSKPAVLPSALPHPESETHTQPQPPPRTYKRFASLQNSNDLNLVVCGSSTSRPHLHTTQSLDVVLKDVDDAESIDNRPKTYDLSNHHKKESQAKDGWFNINNQPSPRTFEFPTISDSSDSGKVEILNLENRENKKGRHETRESREIREITERESGMSDIDNLLDEVVRMQRSVSMLSEVDSPEVLMPTPQASSSARSRRNRAGKMHIEDFLFPAELLEKENNNFRSSGDSSEQSRSVFGSTKSRKSSSKGRRLIEDMLFPPGADFNANSDNNEDGDVVVSANALLDICPSSGGFNAKRDSYVSHFPTSPVALTSNAPSNLTDCDGLPRPKPMSLSTHSSTRNGCIEVNEREPTSNSTSPMQPQNQSRQSNSSRLSGDSAYSSLNRRSPIPHVRRQCANGPQDNLRQGAESPQSVLSRSLTQSLVLSSSGSESSLPPLTTSQSSKRGSRSKYDCDTPSSDIASATTPILPKLSKFCHQCGTKFLIPGAKFCHECGAPRLEIC